MEPEVEVDEKLPKKLGAGGSKPSLHVAHKGDSFIFAQSGLHFTARSTPEAILLIRKKAGRGQAFEVLGGHRISLPVGGDPVAGGGLGSAVAGVPCLRRHGTGTRAQRFKKAWRSKLKLEEEEAKPTGTGK
jgi:hypothetical protein